MRRVMSVAMALLLMLSFVAGLHPITGTAQSTATAGEAISITDAAGEPWIEVSVDSFTPDFTGYERNYAPDRGFQYAHVTVTITNVGEAPYSASYYGFTAIDTEGFASDPAYVSIDESVAPAQLSSDEIAPGESLTGSVVFAVLAGSEVAAIAFEANYDRFNLLATNGVLPAIGDVVEVIDFAGQPSANVTIEDWLDPLPDMGASSPPNRGHHHAGAVVTIENIGSSTIEVDPWSIQMIDSDGYISRGSTPYRQDPEIQDLPYEELDPGDSVTGMVGFQVFNTSAPAVLLLESQDQITFVGSFADAPALPELSSLPEVSAPPVDTTGDGEDEGEDEGEDGPAAQASEECIAADAWMEDLFTQFEENEALDFDLSEAADMSIDELEDARDAVEGVLADLESAEPPALVEDVFFAYVDLIEFSLDAIDQLIEAAENGDDLQPIIDGFNEENEALDAYFEAINVYLEACPAV